MSRLQRNVVLGIAGIAVLGVGYALFAGGKGGNGDPGGYESEIVGRGDIESVVAATGSVRPVVTVELGSELSGLIAELRADFNDEVRAGQVVAVIDPRTFATRVEQAEADLELANASLTSAEAAISRAEANLVQAERAYERNTVLAGRGNLSESALDTALAALEGARADLASANAQKVTARATIAQRRAALRQARIDLERTEIRSPIDGVIVNRVVDVGQTVAASLSAPILFEIARDLSSIQIEASVDEADIGTVTPGDAVRFTVDAYRDRRFVGEVRQVRLAPVELNNVVTYTVIIDAANTDRALLPGMTANLEIVTGSRSNVLRVPNEALRFRPPESVVAAAQPGGGRGPGGGGFANLAGDLGLDAAQEARLREAMAAMRGSFRPQQDAGTGGPPPDPALIRQQFQARMASIMADILTEEQMEKYRALQAEQSRNRPGSLWVLTGNGTLEPRRVMLGIGDSRFTEIVAGLEGGEAVATRIRAAGAV